MYSGAKHWLWVAFIVGGLSSACMPEEEIEPIETSERANVVQKQIVVSTNNQLLRFTLQGDEVSVATIPYPAAYRPTSETARDLVELSDGRLALYNGTFDPYLSTYDIQTDSWTHDSYVGWSTVNNVSYGGIASTQTSIFVTDMKTYGDNGADQAKGIVRFDTTSNTTAAQRYLEFDPDPDFIDLTVGQDGYLYGLRGDGVSVDGYDPASMSWSSRTYLPAQVRSIAVNASGEIFGAGWNGMLYRFTYGAVSASLTSGFSNLVDIDLSEDGKLVVGSRFGDVLLTDQNLSLLTSFSAGTRTAFVAFADAQQAPPPPPPPPIEPVEPQLIEGIVATASSEYGPYTADKVVDDDDRSFWAGYPGQQPWTLALDLGSSWSVVSLEIDWYYIYGAIDFDVQTETNGQITTVAQGLNAPGMWSYPYKSTTVVPLADQTATSVRIVINQEAYYLPVITGVRVIGRKESMMP